MAVDPNIKIVVADDSGTMRIMFKQILAKAGFTNLVMAVNGTDGIEKVKAEKPDLVISDWNMPQMDGLEFLKALRTMDEFKSLPFIMATAQSDKGQQMAIMEAGGNAHCPKPFDEAQISSAIEKALSGESGPSERVKKKRSIMGGRVELNVAHIQITDHLALGAGYPQTGSKNKSGIHWDMLCDMSEAEIHADGELFYKDGKFKV